MRVWRFRSRLALTVVGVTGMALILTFALTGGPQRLADPPRVQAQAECGTYGEHLEPYPDAVVSLMPDFGAPGSPFGVEVSNVLADEYDDQPAEVLWNWNPELGGQLIGEGSVPRGATGGGMDAAVPEDAEPGEHMVTVCWWYSLNETWYWKNAPFAVAEPTPTPSPTPTPGLELTPTPTPTPGPEPTLFPSPTLSPTPAPTPGPTFRMLNCPKPGKWAISVWDGPDDTHPSDALATCDEEGDGVDVAYYIDPDDQVWLGYFAFNPEISNLVTVKGKQGVIAHGKVPGQFPIPTPTATPILGSQIAFQSDRDGNLEIYVMKADGTAQTNLTNNEAEDYSPAWSPDGTKIAFVSRRDGNAEIYVGDGTTQTNLSNNPAVDRSPAWSPDGSKIAFVSERDGFYDFEVYVMKPDGTGQTNLTNSHPQPDTVPVWSPDGSKIAFESKRLSFYNDEVYVMNANGTGQANLSNSSNYDGDPAWSPDSTKIAFESLRSEQNDIYAVKADGTGLTNLSNNPGYEANPAWSPDGAKIAFTSWRDGNYEIYVMNADGTGQTRLTNNPAWDDDPAWSPDGSQIAFVSNRDGNEEIYVMNADGSGQTNLTKNKGSDIDPVWMP